MPPPPAKWATTTEWPLRCKLGTRSIHAAALFYTEGWPGARYVPWTACGRPPGDHHSSMSSHREWDVTCRACRKALNP